MTSLVGSGYACCHHGEILQGVFLDDNGRHCLGLVTLPMNDRGTHAEFVRQPGTAHGKITVSPARRSKARHAAALAMKLCAELSDQPPCGGELRLHSTIPVGLGMGSSTSDIIATMRAVSASFDIELPPTTMAHLAVHAERASDPLMLDDRPVLFAQREGRVLENLGGELPPVVVVGCLTGRGQPVNTLAVPTTKYRHEDLRAFQRLRGMLRQAIACGDVAQLAQVSTESARHHQRILAKTEFDLLTGIAEATGAEGVQVAHSGNVAGLLFDPDAPDLHHRLRHCVRALRANDLPVTRLFRTHRGRRERDHGPPHRGIDRQARPGADRRQTRLPAL